MLLLLWRATVGYYYYSNRHLQYPAIIHPSLHHTSQCHILVMSSRLHHFHSGYCPLSLPSHPYAHNGRWHDNMLYQAPSFVDHRRRIGCRESYLSVAMSRRGCLLPLGVISWTDLLRMGSVGDGGGHGRRDIIGFCVCFWSWISPQNLNCLPSHLVLFVKWLLVFLDYLLCDF